MGAITIYHFIIVFLGGGVGAVLRWLLTLQFSYNSTKSWQGTLIVNLIGCLFFFLITRFFKDIEPDYDLFIKTGILGSLTTFSTFAFDVVFLFKQGMVKEAILALCLNVFFGIIIGIGILR